MNLQQSRWCIYDEGTSSLVSFCGEQPLKMRNSDGTARNLIIEQLPGKHFGADIIRFGPGKGVGLHTHVGSHILMVTQGKGILTYKNEQHPMYEGMIYLIPSNIPHAIEAVTELILVAVGNDHRPADSPDRLDIV